MTVTIWTDGSGHPPGGPIGYAWECDWGHRSAYAARHGTNTQAELLAVIAALDHAIVAHPGAEITVVTDARQVADAPPGGWPGTKYPDLWAAATALITDLDATIHWPPEGRDHPMIECVNGYAYGAMAAARNTLGPRNDVHSR